MNGRKFFMVSCLALALLLIGAALVPAANQDRVGIAAKRAGIGRFLSLKQLAAGLDLTADQKTQIKNILANNKTQILQAVRDVVKGRLDATNGVPNAADELAAARQKAAGLRRSILEQIKPILTADQLAKVRTKMQNRKQRRAQRLQKLLDRLDSKIGA
jgi:Spy/CpxP family protein refolding chaperone